MNGYDNYNNTFATTNGSEQVRYSLLSSGASSSGRASYLEKTSPRRDFENSYANMYVADQFRNNKLPTKFIESEHSTQTKAP